MVFARSVSASMADVALDALLDSLKVFGIAFFLYLILSFLEEKISRLLTKHHTISPMIGAGCGMIPQCGISVVASDLYRKEHITAGTLLAIFFACSDEALPILFSDVEGLKVVLPLLLIKFIFGFILGYAVDYVLKKKASKEPIEEEVHVGCCGHEIDNEEAHAWHKHLLHPLIHSLKIWVYVFSVNLLFGFLIYSIGEDNIMNFLKGNAALAPLLAGLIGLIPNCASSVVITQLYLLEGLSFGALVTGLCVNAGLGLIYLLKFKEGRRSVFKMMGVLVIYSLVIGYLIVLMMSFI